MPKQLVMSRGQDALAERSLEEIAVEMKRRGYPMSKQAVNDTLRRAERKLAAALEEWKEQAAVN